MPELTATLTSARDMEERRNKFSAAIQGINLDANTDSGKGQKEWDDMKARVFSGGLSKDSNDVTSLIGINASQAGFGIGLGLEYASNPENPMS